MTPQAPKAAWGTAGAAPPRSPGSAPWSTRPTGPAEAVTLDEPGPAHPGRDRRAHHRRAAHGVLRGHGHRRPCGRAIPELWPLGTEALALAMEVSVLEAKRLGHRAVLRLSWLLLVASVALSTVLQVAVAPPTLVGYVTAGATPVWLLGSFAVLSLLYRADTSSATQAPTAADPSAERSSNSA